MSDVDVAAVAKAAEQRRAMQLANMAKAREAAAAKRAAKLETPATPPRPEPKPEASPHGWVKLERVVFRDTVECPGRDRGIYPTSATVVEDSPNQHGKRLLLWLNLAEGEIILEHPESHCKDRVPLAAVRSYRRVGDHPGDAPVRVVGMVDRLPDVRPASAVRR